MRDVVIPDSTFRSATSDEDTLLTLKTLTITPYIMMNTSETLFVFVVIAVQHAIQHDFTILNVRQVPIRCSTLKPACSLVVSGSQLCEANFTGEDNEARGVCDCKLPDLISNSKLVCLLAALTHLST
jgi:hypothetical protein